MAMFPLVGIIEDMSTPLSLKAEVLSSSLNVMGVDGAGSSFGFFVFVLPVEFGHQLVVVVVVVSLS
jgi:hypothetical protein